MDSEKLLGVTGLSFTPDSSFVPRRLTGVNFNYLENLIVLLVDNEGDLISNSTIRVTDNVDTQNNGVKSLKTGEWFHLVETSKQLTIEALETDTHIPITPPQTFTFNGSYVKKVVFVMQKVYYYRVRAVRNGVYSKYSNVAKLSNS